MSEHQPSPEVVAQTPTPRIWVASLADYVEVRLHGDWIDAAQSPPDLIDAIGRILSSSPTPGAEEWGIFDFDGFGHFRLNEYEDLSVVSTVAQGIVEYGLAYGAWADLLGGERERLGDFDEAFLGRFDSPEEYVDQLLDDYDLLPALGDQIPEWLRCHITVDRTGIARDLEAAGDMNFIDAGSDGSVWVFDGRA